MKSSYILILLWLTILKSAYSFEYNDGHLHYNEDVWSRLPPKQAINYLTENGMQHAIISSTPNEGTEKLYAIAPNKIIPFLRPYRVYKDRFLFHSDPTILNYLKDKIDIGIYKGIGEFHLFKEHKDTEVIRSIMQIAADHELFISAHSDYETIITLLTLQPDVKIIWAHCGMDHPIADIKKTMKQYQNLFCDLSFRYNMFDDDGKLTTQWNSLLETQSSRFILGMDTYTLRWWGELADSILVDREWLIELSPEAQNNIARENINNLFKIH